MKVCNSGEFKLLYFGKTVCDIKNNGGKLNRRHDFTIKQSATAPIMLNNLQRRMDLK